MALPHEMYPPKPLSPPTALAQPLTDDGLLAELDDASVLPDGPNLMTIYDDEKAETILYESKDGDTVTITQRGFGGTTAYAWSAGAKVARMLTAEDIKALQENLRTGNVLGGSASDPSAVAVHPDAQASALFAIAVGSGSQATGSGGTAIGGNASADGPDAIAIGSGAEAAGWNGIAIGNFASTGMFGLAIGDGAGVDEGGYGSIALGGGAWVEGAEALAVGTYATAEGEHSVAIGTDAVAIEDNEGVLGTDSSDTYGTFKWKIPGSLEVGEGIKGAQVTYTVTVDTDWTGASAPFTKTQSVPGIRETDNPIVDVQMSGTFETDQERQAAWAGVYRVTTQNDQITLYATEKPSVDLPIQLKVVR